nr:MAG TPA: hypothetical protein [Caudoviricetes sp.]
MQHKPNKELTGLLYRRAYLINNQTKKPLLRVTCNCN